jgi:hypothetical protein
MGASAPPVLPPSPEGTDGASVELPPRYGLTGKRSKDKKDKGKKQTICFHISSPLVILK